MTVAQSNYVNKVNRIRSGVDAICKCTICESLMFYGDKIYRIEGEEVCENCIDEFINDNFMFELGDKDIAEPDWDSMQGGADYE